MSFLAYSPMRPASLLTGALLLLAGPLAAQGTAPAPAEDCMPRPTVLAELIGLDIPSSIRAEHAQLRAALNGACRAPGERGRAARDLAGLLRPHFATEERLAYPALGLLRPLGEELALPEFRGMQTLPARLDSLAATLPALEREHVIVTTAIDALQAAALAARDDALLRLTGELRRHARLEEEVLLPAALLAGEALRARLPSYAASPAARSH